MIRFITGFSGFGGSTVALIEHCKLLSESGYEVFLYGADPWPARYFSNFRYLSELEYDSDDVLVFHFWELTYRPRCRLCLLYLHEQGLYDLSSRRTSGFDGFLFVSESQKSFHSKEGLVVPNPMDRLVDLSSHSPPRSNIAGVVGTIQPRKRQHVSISKALDDGAYKVRVFGNHVEPYFSEFIAPLLSDPRVEYMGYFPPEMRMEMYNSFDVLYNFSEDESACLVTGECEILGKPVVKSEFLSDYKIATSSDVLKAWEEVFFGSSDQSH